MSALPLTEAVTASFYAWETRGRGWMLADYPVALEPPFRPFFLLPQLAPERLLRVDDGTRPTFASFLVDGAKRLFAREEVRPEAPPFEEEPPFPAPPESTLTVFSLLVPPDFALHPAAMVQLLAALSAALHPVSFELIGADGRVTLQLVCAAFDAARVRPQVESFVPDVGVIESDDALEGAWDSTAEHVAVDIGLSHEFFLPLASGDFHIDPYVPLIAALGSACAGEFVTVQVLFERVRNSWQSAITEALDDGAGDCTIADAPWFLPAAKEKVDTPLFAVLLRTGAQATTRERAWQLLYPTQAFLLQFENAGGNALMPLANDGYPDGAHADGLLERTSRRTGMILSAAELVALAHFPDASVRHPALERGRLRTKELPAVAEGHELVLGENTHRGVTTAASQDLESRFAHTWLIGGTGTGKSTLLAQLVIQDIAHGHGLLVLDPHGDLIDDIATRVPREHVGRVVLFDPSDVAYPIGFNILDARTEIERNLLASDLVAIFRRFTTSWGDTMSTVLGEAVLSVLTHPEGGTLATLKRVIVDDAFRKTYLARIPDPEIRRFWEKDYPVIGARSAGPLISRLDTFLRSRVVRGIVSQRECKLDLSDVMQRGKVLLVRLGKGLIGEENAYLLGSLLLAKCNQLALARQAVPKRERRPFFCYADEFQNFVTPSIESLATEGRKYRVGIVVAHQMLAQLADVPRIEGALLSSCYTRIVFRVGEGDAKKLADGFSFFEARDLTGLPRGAAIARVGGATNDFNLKTAPLPPVGEEDGETRTTLVDQSRSRYGVPAEELMREDPAIEAEEKRASPQVAQPAAAPREHAPEPTAPASELAIASTPPPSPLTKRSARKPPTPGRGGEQHKYLQHLIKRLAEERGFRASIEDAAQEGRADVVLRRDELVVGCEISITTDAAHELENLKKCLAAGFTRILFIAPERKQRATAAALIRKELPGAPIDVVDPEDLVAALDALGPPQPTSESVTRGYKVKVTRQQLSPADEAERRRTIAGVIARTIKGKS